jgi:hypothetical protein
MATAMTVGLDVRLARLDLVGGAAMATAMAVRLDVGLGALGTVVAVQTMAVRLDIGLIAIVAGVAVCLAVRLVLGHRILLLVGRNKSAYMTDKRREIFPQPCKMART